MDVRVVGVIGAGVIGAGLAQNLAQTGHSVILTDVSDEILDHARQAIRQNLRFQTLFKEEKRQGSTSETLKMISFSTDLAALGEADFVIENVTEKWAVKQTVYKELDSICAGHTIFAANTSAIPITRLAALTARAPQVIGMHFMNPVPLKSMVEVIRGYHTSDETLAAAQGLLARMGKQSIVVKDSPGFVANRVLMLTINEAIFLVHEQVASAEEIDQLFTTCFGHKLGPLATADLIGLDTILFSIEVLYESFNDSKYRPCPLLKRMVEAGLHGRKNGRGFYTYDTL
ncbi:MAG: 3-hydroxyacyl-CoA dehydrogenase NAD-binding domain-containing protein [Acidobacteriota bacterium]